MTTDGLENGYAANGRDALIRIRGARTHNLKNIDLDIPRERLVVVTGLSGSGKSSLALDTLYAEGQRQYIESLSVYARQFLHQLERPDVDLIDGLQPTICIDQRPPAANPRSTVATVTEIYDYLRLLMARLGQAHCVQCDRPIGHQSEQQIQDALMRLPEGAKMMVLAPLVRGRRGRHADVFAKIRKAGLVRVRVDGDVYDIDNAPELNPRQAHEIQAVVDRVVIRPGVRARLGESIRLAAQLSDGLVAACYLNDSSANGQWRDELFSTTCACPDCKISYEELEPRTFSFNSPYGACPHCDGLGARRQFDAELVLLDRELSIAAGGVAPWKGLSAAAMKKRRGEVEPFLQAGGAAWDTPLRELSNESIDRLLNGDGRNFLGLLTLLEKEYATATKKARLAQLETFRDNVVCGACRGARLRAEAMNVRLAGKAIHDITALSIADARRFFSTLSFTDEQQAIGEPIVGEVQSRLDFLTKVGADYLTLDRAADTLSGGELQRVRLATGIGSGLVGVCYVLDEPSIGLHHRDNSRLIQSLRDLQQRGNSVVVVEHDEAMIRAADRLIDIGPGAGVRGGQIVAQGAPDEVARNAASLTGRFLAGEQTIAVPQRRRRTAKTRSITLQGATANNLQRVTARFPLSALVCVTGVSGSGKSSLVNDTLARAVARRLGGAAPKPGAHESLRGVSQIDKLIEIDQSPIGRTPRSNAATYCGAFDEIRKVFAGTRDARQFGFRANRFSFNVKGGRCESCQGQGVERIEMSFLPDLYVTCSVCGGARFNDQTLAVRYRGKTIADVLAMSVDDAAEFFENFSLIHRALESLRTVGLGYLPLGQPSTTISGGEAQRIKLAEQLARVDTGKTLYLLDEPTTGLHLDDIRRLLAVLDRLVDRGNTVIVIEHQLDVVKSADWIIDLGPEGGSGGGRIIAEGPPEQIAACDQSHTGQALRDVLPAE